MPELVTQKYSFTHVLLLKLEWANSIFKQNWGYMWGRHSSNARQILVKHPCNVSPDTKDCRVVEHENWVSKHNIHIELGFFVGSPHPKTMSRLKKPGYKVCILGKKKKTTKTKTRISCERFLLLNNKTKIGQTLYNPSPETKDCRGVKPGKWHVWIDEGPLHKKSRKKKRKTNFFSQKNNFKDNFIIASKPLVCDKFFYNCPIVSIVQIAWMVNCGHQRVVAEKRNFVFVSDCELERVFRKTLEKQVIFDNRIMINTKTLEMVHQDGCELNNLSVFDAYLTGITWWTEPLFFKSLQGIIEVVSHGKWHSQLTAEQAAVTCNSSSQSVRE